jgi:long-chain acyl-CoA synthetase
VCASRSDVHHRPNWVIGTGPVTDGPFAGRLVTLGERSVVLLDALGDPVTVEMGVGADTVEESVAADVQPEDTAWLFYTSGTTGVPKAIPLKHGHVLSAVRSAAAAGYFRQGEVHMAYLPIAWVGDFAFSIGAGLELRFTVNIPESQETALRNLREIAPTLYFSSPRAWSGMLTRIQVGMAESTRFKRWLYDRFMPFAVELERGRLSGRQPTWMDRLRYRLGDMLIYGPIRDQLGLSSVERPYTAGEAIG